MSLYDSYGEYKEYQVPSLSKKDIARFDTEIWQPANCQDGARFLEIGAGTGQFLLYLAHKKVRSFQGIDLDPALLNVMPAEVKNNFSCYNVWEFLNKPQENYDHIIMLDVLEHFTADEGADLLRKLKAILLPGGQIIVKVPNAASPWGLNYQYSDLTHKTAFTSNSLRQLAKASGYNVRMVYEQKRGSQRRQISDSLVNGFLKWALLTPPEFFGANLYMIIYSV